MMAEFVTALGLVLVLEGLLYALAPNAAKRLAEAVRDVPSETLRNGGIAAVVLGVVVVWLVRG